MKRRHIMNNIFYIIGVVVVVAMVLGYFGLR
jgi:predicted nucleic acid-binding Zn ribbon protein